jgi:two-component system chemotaxis response regulator CheB
VTVAVVLDDHALRVFPGLDAELARAGALVMRSFKNTPNPQLLRRHAGVGVVGGPDRAGLLDRLERATTTLAGVPAPVIGILPPGVPAGRELLGPGVVDLVPAGAAGVAERILLMAKVPVVTGVRARPARTPSAPPPSGAVRSGERAAVTRAAAPPGRAPARPAASAPAGVAADVVAVASSTGGVWVLGAMLRDLRGDVAVLIAQHMDAEFVPFFAEWLEGVSGWRVLLVDDDAPLKPGVAFVPAGGCDLVLADGDRVRALPSTSRYVPCADRLLASVARVGDRATGVVLSGMGSDGANGLAELARRGGRAMCQAPASAVVPSMPEAALRAATGAMAIPPDALATTIGTPRG